MLLYPTHLPDQRGAMFGLDARIALAIFGGLSIIAGAALYSAIGQTRATALLTEMDNTLKGIDQFVLDTGRNLTAITAPGESLAFSQLFNAGSIVGWNGPYSNYERSALDMDWLGTGIHSLDHPKYDVVQLYAFRDTSWGSGVTNPATFDCTTPEECHNWVAVGGVPLTVAEQMDRMVDGSVGHNSGNLRVVDQFSSPNDGADFVYVYLKGSSRLR